MVTDIDIEQLPDEVRNEIILTAANKGQALVMRLLDGKPEGENVNSLIFRAHTEHGEAIKRKDMNRWAAACVKAGKIEKRDGVFYPLQEDLETDAATQEAAKEEGAGAPMANGAGTGAIIKDNPPEEWGITKVRR